MVSPEVIEKFLGGNNPLEHVVSIEAGYSEPEANLIINDPEHGKYILRKKYKPFIWFKEEVKHLIYEGKRDAIQKAADRFKIRMKLLTTSDSTGFSPERLQNGYKFIATTSGSYNDLISFFKFGGIDVFDVKNRKLFFSFSPAEQFMIQSSIRLFKGQEDYNDLHRFQFDLETEGLSGKRNAIFQIGMKDNRGFEKVLEVKGNTPKEKRNSERKIIEEFFETINTLMPDIISGYNSESFDWPFIQDRAERLGINLDRIALGLDGISPMKRKPSILKLGNEVENYLQTQMYGHNIIDIAHSVRRAQAINSNIKSWGLKYITQYSEIAKTNRVYVQGDKINTIWADTKNEYAFNDENGDWYKISDKMPLRDNYKIKTGAYIIERYLLDDLWETEQVDTIFNQAAFLISKLLPTAYSRSITMGTATQWKLIMAAWSYENNLAIPATQQKRDFVGGLSRLLQVGYARNVVKLDYAALYPKTQLTHGIFPDLDISGVMEGLLTYIVDTRDTFKFLTETHKKVVKKIAAEIAENKDTYSKEKLDELKEQLKKEKARVNLFDKKQLPLKILANSWFGAYGAPYIFNWGDTNCAEETTCSGRQYLRLMVKHFSEKYGFKALVGDTDGFNFEFPDNINDIKYTAKGSHWKTKDNAGIELTGLDAVLAEFNENYMTGRMGLDIDEICTSTINFSRKNYATAIDGKIKFVGNSIKSKKMPVFIEDFLDKAIKLLLDGRGKEFIEFYYDYVDTIYNYNIPLVKIASKSKVKSTVEDYKLRCRKKNKNGNPLGRQAHMELAVMHDLTLNLGDTVYYVNTGTKKGDGDVKMVKDKEGNVNIVINCKLIDPMTIETNLEKIKEIETLRKEIKELINANNGFDAIKELENKITEFESELVNEEYNVNKYLENLNNKVRPLLVCFHPDIRHNILLSIKTDKKTKVQKLDERKFFTPQECVLVSGMPNVPTDQDDYTKDLMKMEDKEIKFWESVNKLPINMTQEEWDATLVDYHERIIVQRIEGIKFEHERFAEIIQKLELSELDDVRETKVLPISILSMADVDEDGNFVSKKWGVILGHIVDIFKHEEEATKRDEWYMLSNNRAKKKRYESWLKHKEKYNIVFEVIEPEVELDIEEIKEVFNNTEIDLDPEDDEDDEDEDDEDDETPVKKTKPNLKEIAKKLSNKETLFPEKVESAKEYLKGAVIDTPIIKELEKDDEWNF